MFSRHCLTVDIKKLLVIKTATNLVDLITTQKLSYRSDAKQYLKLQTMK